jgi:hypothetical protein
MLVADTHLPPLVAPADQTDRGNCQYCFLGTDHGARATSHEKAPPGPCLGLGGANNQTQENVGPTHPRCLISKQARPNWGTERGTALSCNAQRKAPHRRGLKWQSHDETSAIYPESRLRIKEPRRHRFVILSTNGTGSGRQFASKATRLKLPSGLLTSDQSKRRDPGAFGESGSYWPDGTRGAGGTPPGTCQCRQPDKVSALAQPQFHRRYR